MPKLITYRPPQAKGTYQVHFERNTCVVTGDPSLTAGVEFHDQTLRLALKTDELSESSSFALGVCLECLFGEFPSARKAVLSEAVPSFFKNNFKMEAGELIVPRFQFFQIPWLWTNETQSSPKDEWTETSGRRHPVRPKIVDGVQYHRYVPALGKTISFRTVDVERDLEMFYEWHHQPRVYDLWELNKPIEELKTYLQKGRQDSHQVPMIMEYDGESIGYFEIYWAAEDRLGPYYDYEPYDRGFHFLIGNPKALGVENTDAALRSVAHMIYLKDSRTQRIVAEPRYDNKRVLKYVQIVPGWRFIKEFDFPHKRAALLMNFRDEFFKEGTF